MSLRKYNFKPSKESVWKIVKRTIIIFLIGLALNWFGLLSRGLGAGESFVTAATHFDTIRILGVMQRLALAYGFASIIALLFKPKQVIWVIATLLFGYFFILFFGNGFELSEQNIISVIDRNLWGEAHMYKDSGVALDPEGLLSTLPSIAHVLIGFLFGKMIMDTKDNHKRVEKILIWGTVLAFAGLLLQYGCPINKKIWSPTFVLATTGFAAQLLGLLIWIIDINKKSNWSRFFHSFGVNPLFIYVLSGVLANVLGNVKIPHAGQAITLKGYVYSVLLEPWAGAHFGSLLYALLFVSLCWLAGFILYKRDIYIKI
jgi:predicted acyltransferase